jgi:multidrug efflux pump subunit AcrB
VSIGRFSVSNPVLINILMVVVLALGAFSVSRLPQEQFAEVPFYFVNITVPYPGVSAEDIERSVTVRIENEMSGLENLDQISSVSVEGLSQILIQFDQGIDRGEFERLFQEVQNRFANVNLPDDVLQESIEEFSSTDFIPVIEVVLSGNVEYATLNQAARDLENRLSGIQDVSDILLVGSRDRQIRIEVDPDRLEGIGANLNEVVSAVRSRNVVVPGGTFATPSREFLIRTVGEAQAPEEFREIVVRRPSEGRGMVTVGQVATVLDTFDPDGTSARFNGEQAIFLRVTKIPGGSSVDIAEEVRRTVADFEDQLPANVRPGFLNDSTVQIRDSLDVLVWNALIGLGLLVLLLFAAIGFRNAAMTALGIPITFAITFVVLEALGDTLNSNTLFAMVLVLGLIVDHAIVIVENSYRLQGEGLSRHDAAVKGVDQVIVPVIAATATTVAAFLPLTFLPGVIGRFLRIVPVTVSIALIASTFEAAVFLPSHFADWPGGNGSPKKQPKNRFAGLQRGFETLLRRFYRRRGWVLVGMIIVIIGSFSLIGTIRTNLFESEDFTYFYIDVEMPTGTPLSRTDEFLRQYEQRILPLRGNGEVVSVSSFVGFAGDENENVRNAQVGQLLVDLTESDGGRERSITEIMTEIQGMTRDIAGADSVEFRKVQGGPPTDPPVVFRLFGDDYEQLIAVSERIKTELRNYPELFGVTDNLEGGSPELTVAVRNEIAAQYNLSTEEIGSYVRGSFDGINAGTIFRNNEETDIVVQYETPERASIDRILQLKIPNRTGTRIPFSSVADLESGEAFASIKRLDLEREVTVESEAYSTATVPEINRRIQELFDQELAPEYPGVELRVGGEFAEFANLLGDIARVFLIGIFLIYTILGTQFKSYSQPLLILFTVPFAFVGVILFLVISGVALSTTVIYAGVALAGIAVNDSIVLISFINERRKEGLEISEAVIESARVRLRPILLTSLTTIAGLLPTAIGLGGWSVVWGPMAATIIFGLIFSTITALVLIPSVYGLFYDRKPRAQAA